jgi:hypothetical protein
MAVFMQKCRKPLWADYPIGERTGLSISGHRNVRITPEVEEEVLEIEFDDRDEWHLEYYGTFKSQFRLLAQAITERFAPTAAAALTQYLGSLVQQEQQLQQQARAANLPPALVGTTIEFRRLVLEFEMLHYVYSPLLLTLLPEGLAGKNHNEAGKIAARAGSSSGGGGDADAAALAHQQQQLTAVTAVVTSTLTTVLGWQPDDPMIRLERLKFIQYHYPLLKSATDLLGASFSVMFAALSEGIASASAASAATAAVASGAAGASNSSGDTVSSDAAVAKLDDYNAKVASLISSLTMHCAVEIVRTGFFGEFFRQVCFV